jgi:hypothetical protein
MILEKIPSPFPVALPTFYILIDLCILPNWNVEGKRNLDFRNDRVEISGTYCVPTRVKK